MKIAIDISPIVYGTGVSRYTQNLVSHLLKIDNRNDFILFGGSLRRQNELRKFCLTLKGNFTDKILPLPPTLADIIWNKLHFIPIERFVGAVNVFHSSDWTQPPSKAFKVTTIHDLIPLKFPQLSEPKIISAHKLRLKWIAKEVDRVIVPSKVVADDVENVGIKREKIRVIPEATDPALKKAGEAEVDQIKAKFMIAGKYLLAIGVNPRKNTDRIIKAYEKIKSDLGLKLVIVGHKYIDYPPMRGIIFTGHISDTDLKCLYSGAEALVYPSLDEGFGLPILEAYALKLPVITSNLGSMAELAKGTGITVNPTDVDSISQGIRVALKNKKSLIAKGRKKIKLFSWDIAAKKTLDVYKESLI